MMPTSLLRSVGVSRWRFRERDRTERERGGERGRERERERSRIRTDAHRHTLEESLRPPPPLSAATDACFPDTLRRALAAAGALRCWCVLCGRKVSAARARASLLLLQLQLQLQQTHSLNSPRCTSVNRQQRLAADGSCPAGDEFCSEFSRSMIPHPSVSQVFSCRRDGLGASSGSTDPCGPHSSSGCCQLLSRQCRSCVAISSYIWLLGLRRLGLLPGQTCPSLSHWLVAHSFPPIGCDVRGARSCDPTDRMFSVSQLHKGPLSRFFLFVCVCVFHSFLFCHSSFNSLFLPPAL